MFQIDLNSDLKKERDFEEQVFLYITLNNVPKEAGTLSNLESS